MFTGIGIAAYIVAMVATLPASVAFGNRPWRSGVAGTVWNGEVGVAGGAKFEWHWAPLRSLTSLGFAADWTATGPDTDLGGRVLARPGRLVLDNVSGAADASLLQAIQPDLPFTCAMTMQVEFERIALGGGDSMAQGDLTTDPGTCTPKNAGATSSVDALYLRAEHIGTDSRIRLTPATQRRRVLMDMTLGENGTLDVRMTRDGATALPFVGMPGGTAIQGEL